MFLGYQDGLIKSVWEDVTDSEGTIVSGKPLCVEFDEIVPDTKHTLKDYVLVENSYVLRDDPKVVEYKCGQVRAYRDRLISSFDWRLDRYERQKANDIDTTESAYDYLNLNKYIQYLRDYTKLEDWYLRNPLSYDEWFNATTEKSNG